MLRADRGAAWAASWVILVQGGAGAEAADLSLALVAGGAAGRRGPQQADGRRGARSAAAGRREARRGVRSSRREAGRGRRRRPAGGGRRSKAELEDGIAGGMR